jgi:anti-sigma B factor antagonist
MLHLRFEENRGALVVTPLARDLDAEVAGELRDQVGALAERRERVVLSLAHVRSMDASALAAVVAILQRMPPGGELRLAHVAPRVRALLSLTGLDEVLPTFDDAAVATDA